MLNKKGKFVLCSFLIVFVIMLCAFTIARTFNPVEPTIPIPDGKIKPIDYGKTFTQPIPAKNGGGNIRHRLITESYGGRQYTPVCLTDCHIPMEISFTKLKSLYSSSMEKYFRDNDGYDKSSCIIESGYDVAVETENTKDVWRSVCNPFNETIVANKTLIEVVNNNCTIEKTGETENYTTISWIPINQLAKVDVGVSETVIVDLWAKKKPSCELDAIPEILGSELPYAWWNSSFDCSINYSLWEPNAVARNLELVEININPTDDWSTCGAPYNGSIAVLLDGTEIVSQLENVTLNGSNIMTSFNLIFNNVNFTKNQNRTISVYSSVTESRPLYSSSFSSTNNSGGVGNLEVVASRGTWLLGNTSNLRKWDGVGNDFWFYDFGYNSTGGQFRDINDEKIDGDGSGNSRNTRSWTILEQGPVRFKAYSDAENDINTTFTFYEGEESFDFTFASDGEWALQFYNPHMDGNPALRTTGYFCYPGGSCVNSNENNVNVNESFVAGHAESSGQKYLFAVWNDTSDCAGSRLQLNGGMSIYVGGSTGGGKFSAGSPVTINYDVVLTDGSPSFDEFIAEGHKLLDARHNPVRVNQQAETLSNSAPTFSNVSWTTTGDVVGNFSVGSTVNNISAWVTDSDGDAEIEYVNFTLKYPNGTAYTGFNNSYLANYSSTDWFNDTSIKFTVVGDWTFEFKASDGSSTGTSTNIVNVSNTAPAISSIECYDGSSWVTTFSYNDDIQKCHATITDAESNELTINMSLDVGMSSRDDTYDSVDRLYSDFANTSNAGDVFEFNFDDTVANESGVYAVYINVTDAYGLGHTLNISWTIAWGTVSLDMSSPSGNISVRNGTAFTATVNVSCATAECGNVTVYADPKTGDLLSIVVNDEIVWQDPSLSVPDKQKWYHKIWNWLITTINQIKNGK